MTERQRERRETGREARRDGSRQGPARAGGFRAAAGPAAGVRIAVLVLGTIAAVLMLVSAFATVVSVDVAEGSCEVIVDADPALADSCVQSGIERNGGVFLLIGLGTLGMTLAAGLGASRPAATALVALGALALAIAVLSDLPAADDTGAIGPRYEGAEAMAGAGLYLELLAGPLAAAAGALGLLARPRAGRRDRSSD